MLGFFLIALYIILLDLGTIPKDWPSRWSCPNPYIRKTIPTSSRCGTICSIQISTISPSNKESPCKLNYLHIGRSNAPSRSYLHCVKRRHALWEALIAVGHSSTPRGHAYCKGAPLLNFSRANISFTLEYQCSIEIISSLREEKDALCEAPITVGHSSTPRGTPIVKEHHY